MLQLPPQPTITANKQAPLSASQESAVHALPSLQTFAPNPVHLPATHTSWSVQRLPSLQLPALSGVNTQPTIGSHLSELHTLPSSQTFLPSPAQTPALQTSPVVHSRPSSHAATLLLIVQPVLLLHASLVQGLASLHTLICGPTQAPSLQISPLVQADKSSQAAAFGKATQPTPESQVSLVQGFLSSQTNAGPAWHLPAWQLSPWVQTDPSASQLLPSLTGAGAHLPVTASQVLAAQAVFPAMSHTTTVARSIAQTLALQISEPLHKLASSNLAQSAFLAHWHVNAPPWHAPSLHASPLVQPLPSSQATALLACKQPDFGSQESVVQRFLSSHPAASTTPAHTPSLQLSALVQALSSSQSAVLLGCWQPFSTSQLSSVQAVPSLQRSSAPAQTPSTQVSFLVQILPSSQGPAWPAWLQSPVFTSQLSAVQMLLSSQFLVAPATQPPSTQTSPTVQPLPSSQASLFGVFMQPWVGSHLSSVHGLPSSHTSTLPVQAPDLQASFAVQALASLQGVLSPSAVLAHFPVTLSQDPVTQDESALHSTCSAP